MPAHAARASRALFPEPEGVPVLPLSAEERAKADAHRTHAARKLKMAKLLGAGDLREETRAPLLEAALSIGRALAVEARLPEPGSLDDALLPPLSHCWKGALPSLREFACNAESSWEPVLKHLEAM